MRIEREPFISRLVHAAVFHIDRTSILTSLRPRATSKAAAALLRENILDIDDPAGIT
jgi:hypothetical protein